MKLEPINNPAIKLKNVTIIQTRQKGNTKKQIRTKTGGKWDIKWKYGKDGLMWQRVKISQWQKE